MDFSVASSYISAVLHTFRSFLSTLFSICEIKPWSLQPDGHLENQSSSKHSGVSSFASHCCFLYIWVALGDGRPSSFCCLNLIHTAEREKKVHLQLCSNSNRTVQTKCDLRALSCVYFVSLMELVDCTKISNFGVVI